jgi:hypothetical protein
MSLCAHLLELDAEETSVYFGKRGDHHPNFQVRCGARSFLFWGSNHKPYTKKLKSGRLYVPNEFREDEFDTICPERFAFSYIDRLATQYTSADSEDYITNLDVTYEHIILPTLPGESDQANAKRRYRANRKAERDRDFRGRLLAKQGTQNHCSVCKMSILEGLQAAHVEEVKHDGPDNIENGLILCGTHHLLFDEHLFGIDPSVRTIVPSPHGPTKLEMQITKDVISEAVGKTALERRWLKCQENWSKLLREE